MKLKTYRAASMADALAAVKKDLGREAIILHTRQVKSGGWFGLLGRRRTLVEITASDEPPRAGGRRPGKSQPRPERPASASLPAPGTTDPVVAGVALTAYRKAGASPSPTSTSAVEVKPSPTTAPPAASNSTQASTADESAPQIMRVRQRREAGGVEPSEEQAPGGARLYRELSDIKLLVNQVLQTAGPSSPRPGLAGAGTMPDALFRHYLRLLEAAVSRDIADSVIGAVRDELSPSELGDESIVRTALLRQLEGLIPIADQLARPGATPDGRPLTIALVGPTGVGKTTTVAKLAATYKLRQGRSVALITSDTYRIAAVDQLRTYASILGVPLKVVMTPAEMEAAITSLANFDVVLIDTAGRSHNAVDRIRELSEFLDAAAPHETHLVLSSAASESVLLRAAEAFAQARPNRLILSKLDEAVNFGVVVNVAQRLSAKLSFVTTGQEVPDHIEPGRADRLARMVLDNSLSAGTSPRTPSHASAQAERQALLGAGAG